jgi:hypothetical protein
VRAAAEGPEGRQTHRLFERVTRRGKLHAHIERHRNIAPDGLLKRDNVLGREPMLAPIKMRPKRDAVVIDLTPALQTENLKAARIRKNWPFPSHKCMEAACALDRLQSGPQPEMIRVRKHDLRLRFHQLGRRQSLDRPRRPHRHKTRRLHNSVRELQPPAPRVTVFSEKLKHSCCCLRAREPACTREEAQLQMTALRRCVGGETQAATHAAPVPEARTAIQSCHRADR